MKKTQENKWKCIIPSSFDDDKDTKFSKDETSPWMHFSDQILIKTRKLAVKKGNSFYIKDFYKSWNVWI